MSAFDDSFGLITWDGLMKTSLEMTWDTVNPSFNSASWVVSVFLAITSQFPWDTPFRLKVQVIDVSVITKLVASISFSPGLVNLISSPSVKFSPSITTSTSELLSAIEGVIVEMLGADVYFKPTSTDFKSIVCNPCSE